MIGYDWDANGICVAVKRVEDPCCIAAICQRTSLRGFTLKCPNNVTRRFLGGASYLVNGLYHQICKIHVHINAYIHIYIYIHIHVYVYIYMHIYLYIHIYIYITNIHTYI